MSDKGVLSVENNQQLQILPSYESLMLTLTPMFGF